MSAANQALIAIGGDVSFTVSYAVASELRASAVTGGMTEYELIGVVLLIAVLLSTLVPVASRGHRVLAHGWQRWRARLRVSPNRASQNWPVRLLDWALGEREQPGANGGGDGREARPGGRNLLAFAALLLATAQRIAISLLVQSVAATAVANQSLRHDRLLTLLAVAVFFIFLQSGAAAVNNPR
jgi:hypothetical protein